MSCFMYFKVTFTMWLGKIFKTKKEESRAPTIQESISKLRETEEMLMKKQNYLEKKIQQETQIARNNASSNKRIALLALRRKKQHEKDQQQIDEMVQKIGTQIISLENAVLNDVVLKAMGGASKTMKAVHKNIDVDKIHVLMEDIAEQQNVANEIAQAISNPVGNGFDNDIDEDELLAELKELETINAAESIPQEDICTRLPVVPKDALSVQSRNKDDDDIAVLEELACLQLPHDSKDAISTQQMKQNKDDDIAVLEEWACSQLPEVPKDALPDARQKKKKKIKDDDIAELEQWAHS